MSQPRFSIIPAGAVTDRTLEPRDLQVLCLLGRHTDKAGWCTRSQVRMAQELDCSRGSVQNSLERLSTARWIEMKRRDLEVEEAGKRPSRSYAYRVLLDRDDFAFESAVSSRDDDDADSHAENASDIACANDAGVTRDEGGCQQVGTPEVPTDQHPGANACDGTPANPCDGTKNVPLERPPLEREREARAKDRKARFLVSFEQRWPTAAADDRQRTAYAAEALTEAEEEGALAGIGPFLENLKRLHRKNVPAGWRYLEEKRWTLLEAQKAAAAPSVAYPRDSVEARALLVLHDIAGCSEGFRKIYRAGDGSVSYYRKPVTPQMAALSQAPPRADWVEINRQQAGAWEALLREAVLISVRKHLREGDRAPWPWPPSAEGKIYTTGPPETLMSEQDVEDFK